MADVTQNVLIDFTSNNQQLQATIDLVAQSNALSAESVATYKQVNTAIAQNTQVVDANAAATTEQQAIYDKLARSLINLSGESKKATQDLLQLKPADISKGFDQLGISVDQYVAILESASVQQTTVSKGQNTLRTQLLATKNAMAQLQAQQASGNALTAEQTTEFDQLALKAGKLSNALQQTNQVTKNFASNEPLLTAFTEGVSGLAGAFQAAVGAEALFGADNKELQETLVKVTSVTAIAQGVQQALNLVKKEGAITTAAIVIQEKLEAAQLAINNGLESESTIIRGVATVAQKALNAAMAANPIAIIVAALVIFVAALYEYTQSTKAAVAEQEKFNALLESATTDLAGYTDGIQDALDKQNSLLKDQGATQSTILQNTLNNLKIQQAAIEAEQAKANQALLIAQNSTAKTAADDYKKAQDVLAALDKQSQANQTAQYKAGLEQRRSLTEEGLNDQISLAQAADDASAKNSTKQFATQRQLANAQAALALEQARGNSDKQIQINADLQKKLHDINIAEAEFTGQDQLAVLQTNATKAAAASKAINDRQTQAELDANNALLQKEFDNTVLSQKLTSNEIIAGQAKVNEQVAENNRNFRKQQDIETNQDAISRDATVLNDLKLNLTEQLNARIDSIQDAAQIEIDNNRGNSAKIEEIKSKETKDILQARVDAINQATAYEVERFQVIANAENIILQKSLDDQAAIRNASGGLGSDTRVAKQLGVQKQSTEQQLTSIDLITENQNASVDAQIAGLDKVRKAQGFLTEDQEKQQADLVAQSIANTAAGEKAKQQLQQQTADLQKKRNQEIVQDSLQGVSDGLNVLASFYQQQDQAATNAINAQKQRVQDELDAGNITAKAAAAQQKSLDVQAKKLQIEQAKRNKEIAIFQAIINTALAVTNAITTGDPYTAILRAAIAGAIGAAQIAVIASQPLPSFNKGKKDNWSGYGEVGERKPELVQKDGQMFLVNKPTVMYLGAKDKVFTPSETQRMMEDMSFGQNMIASPGNSQIAVPMIDYERMGESIGKNIPQHGLELTESGLREWVRKGNTTIKYLNKRKGWH